MAVGLLCRQLAGGPRMMPAYSEFRMLLVTNLTSRFSLAALLCLLSAASFAAPKATVQDLAWMQGAWAGDLGPNRLEERWNAPRAGTLASLVRMTGATGTSMIELIVIEEEAGSLVLRLQQWNPGFEPRTEGPQVFALESLGKRTVTWKALGSGGLQSLTYSRHGKRKFQVDGTTADGNAFSAKLRAVR